MNSFEKSCMQEPEIAAGSAGGAGRGAGSGARGGSSHPSFNREFWPKYVSLVLDQMELFREYLSLQFRFRRENESAILGVGGEGALTGLFSRFEIVVYLLCLAKSNMLWVLGAMEVLTTGRSARGGERRGSAHRCRYWLMVSLTLMLVLLQGEVVAEDRGDGVGAGRSAGSAGRAACYGHCWYNGKGCLVKQYASGFTKWVSAVRQCGQATG